MVGGMTTETEAKWRARVQAWRASGKSADAFAEGEGFKASTLRFWASNLKTASSSSLADVPMAQVVRRSGRDLPVALRPARIGEIAVVIGDARIAVERGFDPQLLREIVLALGGAK